jgi:hypothetical protein
MIGELDAGNPHVQFDEGAQETCDSVTRLCPTLRSPQKRVPPFLINRFVLPAHSRFPFFRRMHVSAFNFCMSLFR